MRVCDIVGPRHEQQEAGGKSHACIVPGGIQSSGSAQPKSGAALIRLALQAAATGISCRHSIACEVGALCDENHPRRDSTHVLTTSIPRASRLNSMIEGPFGVPMTSCRVQRRSRKG